MIASKFIEAQKFRRFTPTYAVFREPCSLKIYGGHEAVARPDPIPNSAVKHRIADGSACIACARVGSRRTFQKQTKAGLPTKSGFLAFANRISPTARLAHLPRCTAPDPAPTSPFRLPTTSGLHSAQSTRWALQKSRPVGCGAPPRPNRLGGFLLRRLPLKPNRS